MEKYFQIGQISAGWICGKLTDGKSTVYFSNSYITNFLDDFMLALLTILNEYPADEHKEVFRTVEEPTASIWKVAVVPDNLITIHIDSFSSMECEELIRSEHLCFPKASFLQDFITEMERILNKFGLYGYRMEWDSEFPLSLFLKLKSVYEKTDVMSVSEISEMENQGVIASCTSLEKECKMLQSCL